MADATRPNIMWYVNENSVYTPYEEYYSGSYDVGSTVDFNVQVWNNRLGTDDVADAVNPKLVLFFDSIENSILLSYLSVTIDGSDVPVSIELDKAFISIGKTLSGMASNSVVSRDNYADVDVKIGPLPNGLRNEIKNLFIDIQYDL